MVIQDKHVTRCGFLASSSDPEEEYKEKTNLISTTAK
jgi:hypothetical protein